LLIGTLTSEPGADVNNGGPNAEQSLSSQEGLLFSCIVSYGAVFRSIRPHWTALIVKSAIWGPRYRTNVCKPDPARKRKERKVISY